MNVSRDRRNRGTMYSVGDGKRCVLRVWYKDDGEPTIDYVPYRLSIAEFQEAVKAVYEDMRRKSNFLN